MLSDPLIAARRLQVPSVVHARELIDADPDLARHFGCEAADVVSSMRAAADFIIANSDATHRLYYKQDRSFRLYNCIDVERFNLPNDFEPGRLKVGIISSNVPKKGIEHFVKLAILASHRLPHLEFLVIGPRTEHAIDLERVAQAEEFPVNLRFAGYVADPVEAVRQVNVVVSFSIFAELFGRTIAEAMAASRPVIAYGWGAAPELVRDGKDGFIIPYLEFQTALDCLQVLSDNPDRVREMGRNGRERARNLVRSGPVCRKPERHLSPNSRFMGATRMPASPTRARKTARTRALATGLNELQGLIKLNVQFLVERRFVGGTPGR